MQQFVTKLKKNTGLLLTQKTQYKIFLQKKSFQSSLSLYAAVTWCKNLKSCKYWFFAKLEDPYFAFTLGQFGPKISKIDFSQKSCSS